MKPTGPPSSRVGLLNLPKQNQHPARATTAPGRDVARGVANLSVKQEPKTCSASVSVHDP